MQSSNKSADEAAKPFKHASSRSLCQKQSSFGGCLRAVLLLWAQDMRERSQPGTFAYFFAEPEQPGPVFFKGLPPEGFSGARLKSPHRAQAADRMTIRLQVWLGTLPCYGKSFAASQLHSSMGSIVACAQALRMQRLQPVISAGIIEALGMQALADIFSDHEAFIVGELQPFFETSSNLAKAPAWGIVDAAFLRHLMADIKRCALLKAALCLSSMMIQALDNWLSEAYNGIRT